MEDIEDVPEEEEEMDTSEDGDSMPAGTSASTLTYWIGRIGIEASGLTIN